jgi:hypothetical protein
MFLEFKFRDNDFSWDAIQALNMIWKWIKNDIDSHSLSSNSRTIPEAFKYLHERGLLVPMIKKMVVLNATNHDVEWATRGIHDSKYTLQDKIKPASEGIPFFEKYFDKIEIEFHDNGKFTIKDENGEYAWLDLDSGRTGNF